MRALAVFMLRAFFVGNKKADKPGGGSTAFCFGGAIFLAYSSIDVQCGQRVASSAISPLQNGQMRLGLAGAASGFL